MQKPSWFKPENNLNVLLTVAGFSVAIVIGGACMEAQANGPAMQIAELEMEDAPGHAKDPGGGRESQRQV